MASSAKPRELKNLILKNRKELLKGPEQGVGGHNKRMSSSSSCMQAR